MKIDKQSAHAVIYPFEDTRLHYDNEGGAYIYNYDGSLVLCIYEAEYGEDFWWTVFDANTYTVLDNMKFGLAGQPTIEKAIQNFLKKSIYADEFDLNQRAARKAVRPFAERISFFDWRNSIDGYYDMLHNLSEDFWTEIDGSYLMLVDDDIFSIEQGQHGEWELSSYNEGRLMATYAKDCDSPQDAVDMANQGDNWIGNFRLPKLGKRFNTRLSEISISLMDGTNNLYEGVDDDGNLVWFEDSGYGGVEWYWSVIDPNTYMPIKNSDYYSSSLDEAIDDYTLATGQAVRVALRKRAERKRFKNSYSHAASNKNATRHFTYAEMQELDDEIEGRELHNANRLRYTTGTELM